MDFYYYKLDNCQYATGTVVVIDVLRAFTTAAFAFAAGAKSIKIVRDSDEAFLIRDNDSKIRLMGEGNGIKIAGFDYGNSPAEFLNQDLSGMDLVQRTSAGTLGVIRSCGAEILLATSFCCAGTTVHYLKILQQRSISFVITGITPEERGDEDTACADYLSALYENQLIDPTPFLDRVRNSVNARLLAEMPINSGSDLEFCCQLDRFNFIMRVDTQEYPPKLHKLILDKNRNIYCES